MAANLCPLCSKPVGLGTYFNRIWFARIDCPSCGKRVKVEGVALYYLLTSPPALWLGLSTRQLRAEHGSQAMWLAIAVFLLFVTALLAIGLLTWMKLVPDEAT